MQQVEHWTDYGDIILEIDKLVRRDRDELYGNAWSTIVAHNARNNSTLGKLSALGITNQHASGLSMNSNRSMNCSGSDSSPRVSICSLMGELELEDPNAPKDMRQVRLFKTRFCSYGADCPYMARGKCLYAHNKDEIRFRPPPPTSYKKPSPPTSILQTTPTVFSGESVWKIPETTEQSPLSLFDFLSPSSHPETATASSHC